MMCSIEVTSCSTSMFAGRSGLGGRPRRQVGSRGKKFFNVPIGFLTMFEEIVRDHVVLGVVANSTQRLAVIYDVDGNQVKLAHLQDTCAAARSSSVDQQTGSLLPLGPEVGCGEHQSRCPDLGYRALQL